MTTRKKHQVGLAGVLGAAVLAAACMRLGFAPPGGDAPAVSPDLSPPADLAPAPDLATPPITVCASGCAFTDIAPAVSFATSLAAPPAGGRIVIEVRDSRTYPVSAGTNITIAPPTSKAPMELRAGDDAWPTILGSGGRGKSALAIAAPGTTVGGFLFRGTSQRAIIVTASGVTIHHNAFSADFNAWDLDQFHRGTGVLLSAQGTRDASLHNNTFYDCEEALQVIDAATAGNRVNLRNNIFVQLTRGQPAYEPIIWFKPSVSHYTLTSDYNLFYFTGAECIAWNGSTPIISLQSWQAAGLDKHGISVDPLLVDPAGHDFHLRSQGGRYSSAVATFIADTADSPAIDAGDPAFPVGKESLPHGNRINLGRFGGTIQASRSN